MYMYVCIYVCICRHVCMYAYVCVCIHVYVCMHNISGGIVRGVNVLLKMGRGIVRGELSYTLGIYLNEMNEWRLQR